LIGLLEELGVRPVINAAGTVTILGGCLVDDEVLDAMREAAKVYLDMSELHNKVGAYIAKLTGAEAAYVSAGAAAGLVLSVGACMTGGNTDLMGKLPRSEGMKSEVIVQKVHRNMYDHNLEVAGARIREIGSEEGTGAEELQNAINEKTAAVVYFAFDPQDGVLPLSQVLEISHKKGVPVIVDAAAELPPKENLRKFVRMDADLVLFSGGKDIGAPNDTGVILGKRELVGLCMRLGPQSYEKTDSKLRVYIGRPMKTSKEDILAVAVAVKRYLETDHDHRTEEWEKKVQYMVEKLSKCKALKVRRIIPGFGHNRPACIPRVEVEFTDGRISADELATKLKNGAAPIYTYTMNGRLYLNPHCLKDGEEELVVTSIIELLS
jgi:uncharacterized pyridoxal phosphate-dependent enzyme